MDETTYAFRGKKEDINKLKNFIKKAKSSSLSNDEMEILEGRDLVYIKFMEMRMEILDLDDEAVLSLYTFTIPDAKVWRRIIERLKLDIKFCILYENFHFQDCRIYDPHGLGIFDNWKDDWRIEACLDGEDIQTPLARFLASFYTNENVDEDETIDFDAHTPEIIAKLKDVCGNEIYGMEINKEKLENIFKEFSKALKDEKSYFYATTYEVVDKI